MRLARDAAVREVRRKFEGHIADDAQELLALNPNETSTAWHAELPESTR